MSPTSMVQPFRHPSPLITTKNASQRPPPTPDSRSSTSTKGALEAASVAWGTMKSAITVTPT